VLLSGPYALCEEFCTSKPATIDGLAPEPEPRQKNPWMGIVGVNLPYIALEKKVKKVWGFSDGTTAFVWHEIEFFPSQHKLYRGGLFGKTGGGEVIALWKKLSITTSLAVPGSW
jgi:hypothetical protein